MVRLHIIISGQVQGVGYRWFAKKEAERLGLTGFARNLQDGSVEIEVQGDPSVIDDFVGKLKIGPRLATVDEINHAFAELQTEETEFLAF